MPPSGSGLTRRSDSLGAHDLACGPGTFAVMTCQLFAGISVSDYPVALDWYERLLGQPPSFSPNDVEWVWDINESVMALS